MDSVLAALRDSSTPALYRRNTFRITGLSTTADRPTVRQRRQKVLTLIGVGAAEGDPQEVARAFDLILGDPRRRLVDELFWFWDSDTSTCDCPSTLHRDHDEAVLSHYEVLEREALSAQLSPGELRDLNEDWKDAATEWASVLRRVAFWDHVRSRIRALDDKQLDESAIDVIRDELPSVLVKPLVVLAAGSETRAANLRVAALDWPAPRDLVLDLFEQSAEPLYEGVTDAVREAREALENSRPAVAANALTQSALPRLERLNTLAPATDHRRTVRARNDVAIGFNNCAVQDIDARGAPAEQAARKWLATAERLASDPDTRNSIAQNTEYVGQVVRFTRQPRYAPASQQPQPSNAGCVGCLTWLVLIALGIVFVWWVSR
ncbi:hypothetical protein [Cryptosporangium sp. NPDC048952]|uniref:hypothetical protein n=1 Tax=Cryptosporangium sp. NPDC048952 TaxID=3363961 RepID=UPI00372188E1